MLAKTTHRIDKKKHLLSIKYTAGKEHDLNLWRHKCIIRDIVNTHIKYILISIIPNPIKLGAIHFAKKDGTFSFRKTNRHKNKLTLRANGLPPHWLDPHQSLPTTLGPLFVENPQPKMY